MRKNLHEDNLPINLAGIMSDLSINQAELADMAGVDRAIISRILSRERTPMLRTLVSIINALPECYTFEDLVK